MITRPTVLFQGKDEGDSYYFWQWIGADLSEPKIHIVKSQTLQPLVTELTNALPGAVEGESEPDLWRDRVLLDGPFSTLQRELDFSRRLSAVVLPAELAAEIVAKSLAAGMPVLLLVQPSPWCAKVPWELLTLELEDGSERRLLEFADIASDLPRTLYAERETQPSEWTETYAAQPVVYVIDPPTFVEGHVLLDSQFQAFVTERNLVGGRAPQRDQRLGRRELSSMLRDSPKPSRLFYLGHVASSAIQPGATSMLLSDRDYVYGVADAVANSVGNNRPFSAFDAVEGTLSRATRESDLRAGLNGGAPVTLVWPLDDERPLSGAQIWPMPTRVALIACNSGSDVEHPEPFGLVIALISSGAGLVTATRWTLPTDRAFREGNTLTTGDPQPLLEMAIRIDAEHESEDPVRGLARWQREQLAAWQSTSGTAEEVALSPILWGSVITYLAPESVPTDLTEEELRFLNEPDEDLTQSA